MKIYIKKILIKTGSGYFIALKIFYALKYIINRITHLNIYPSCLIILYHRIADIKDDPHLLSVSPENFRNQLVCLKKRYKIIKLSELVNDVKNKNIKRNTAVITFDDGYADNFYNALPILKELNIPATIFITVGKIDSNEPFYWDKKTSISDQGRALTKEELVKLSGDSLIEIGAHTMTHPNLSSESAEKQNYEINESKVILEKMINKPVMSFAYPFGGKQNFDQNSIDLVKKSSYQYACSVFPGRVCKKTDIFSLPRNLVRNWDAEKFLKKINIF